MDEYHHRLLLKNATSAQDTKATVITAEVELHHYVIHWKMGMIFKTLQPGNNNVCFWGYVMCAQLGQRSAIWRICTDSSQSGTSWVIEACYKNKRLERTNYFPQLKRMYVQNKIVNLAEVARHN